MNFNFSIQAFYQWIQYSSAGCYQESYENPINFEHQIDFADIESSSPMGIYLRISQKNIGETSQVRLQIGRITDHRRNISRKTDLGNDRNLWSNIQRIESGIVVLWGESRDKITNQIDVESVSWWVLPLQIGQEKGENQLLENDSFQIARHLLVGNSHLRNVFLWIGS